MTGLPPSQAVGKNVILEEDGDEDFATSATRLLKLVDQDFADVAGVCVCAWMLLECVCCVCERERWREGVEHCAAAQVG